MDYIIDPFKEDEEQKKLIQNQLAGNRQMSGSKSQETSQKNAVDLASESGFGDLWQAQIGYQYDPILESTYRWYKYKDVEHDSNFDSLQDMQGYEGHESSLIVARNQEEEDDIKRAIDENRDRRATMAEFGFGANLLAGILDPINLLAIPFAGAGFVTAGARSASNLVVRRGIATGAGVGVTQVVLEGARAPFDPMNGEFESFMNIGMATLAGGIIGSAIAIPAARKLNVIDKTVTQKAHVKSFSRINT